MAAYPAVTDGISMTRPEPKTALPLQFLRASGLAQARLQLAVLAGNRRRALEQLDKLVEIDRAIERYSDGVVAVVPPLGQVVSDLADQRLAIASEKLALISVVELPRLEPAFGAGMGTALAAHEEVEIVEDEVLASRFTRVLLWASGFVVLSVGVAAAAVTQL